MGGVGYFAPWGAFPPGGAQCAHESSAGGLRLEIFEMTTPGHGTHRGILEVFQRAAPLLALGERRPGHPPPGARHHHGRDPAALGRHPAGPGPCRSARVPGGLREGRRFLNKRARAGPKIPKKLSSGGKARSQDPCVSRGTPGAARSALPFPPKEVFLALPVSWWWWGGEGARNSLRQGCLSRCCDLVGPQISFRPRAPAGCVFRF